MIRRGRRQRKITVRIWEDDWELLRTLYPSRRGGYNIHVREAINRMCERIRAELKRRAEAKLSQEAGRKPE